MQIVRAHCLAGMQDALSGIVALSEGLFCGRSWPSLSFRLRRTTIFLQMCGIPRIGRA